MALKIADDCVNCDACAPACPNEAITNGVDHGLDIFVINPDLCTECVGFHDEPQCAAVCPIDDVCVNDDNHKETEEALLLKAKKIHPGQTFPEEFPSRFRTS